MVGEDGVDLSVESGSELCPLTPLKLELGLDIKIIRIRG